MKMDDLEKDKPLREYLRRVVDRIELGYNVAELEKERDRNNTTRIGTESGDGTGRP